jgi:hypothetical protein
MYEITDRELGIFTLVRVDADCSHTVTTVGTFTAARPIYANDIAKRLVIALNTSHAEEVHLAPKGMEDVRCP